VKAVGQQSENGLFFVAEGAVPVFNDWHKGEIIVERHGMLHPMLVFLHNREEIATLKWKRARSGVYEANKIRLELQVGSLGKKICAKDDFSQPSFLLVKSPLSPRKAKMLIELADSDGFFIHQYRGKTPADGFVLHVTKKHYVSYLIRLQFNFTKRSSREVARIHVPPIMRWEAHHFHQLIALVMAHVAFTQDHGLYYKQKETFLREPTSLGRRKHEFNRHVASGMNYD
jgi:hypothetical protein